MNEEIDIILSRYFSGEATKKELRLLDTWLSERDENEEKFHQMTLLYQYAGHSYNLPVLDIKQALAKFKTHIHKNKKTHGWKFAKTVHFYRAAAAIALLLISAFALFYFVKHAANTVQLMAVETQKEYTLFENADVTLFAGSEIIYDTKNKNKVQLSGKATFHVNSQPSVSGGIIIQAGETFIKDVGTVFTVDATQPDKSIIVNVTEGEVLFYTNQNSGVSVKAGESAGYDTKIKQFWMLEEAPGFHELIFQNRDLQEVIETLSARYGVKISIQSKQLNTMLLNVSFVHDESIEYVLDIITATLSAQWTKTGETYIITSEY